MPFEIRRRGKQPSPFTLCRRLVGPSLVIAAVVGIRQITASSSEFSKRVSHAVSTTTPNEEFRTVQVQVIHRHGDRTPITAMKDEAYWASKLVPPEWQEKIAEGTHILRNPGQANTHFAKGRGPFGKLTQLGLFQMIGVGETLRDDLHRDLHEDYRPLQPEHIRVVSTDFPRTIQSVRGVLVGLFPDGPGKSIQIDCRHTDWLIPDPQPRRSQEQTDLEAALSSRPHILQRDEELKPLAIKCTDALRDLLANDAFEVSYGIGEEKDSSSGTVNTKPLAWAQLAEITKCLKVHNRLPTGEISDADIETLSGHTAWRWFENLRNPRLTFLAMNKFALTILNSMHSAGDKGTPPVTIYSAHDSSLIGLLSAFRLEQPVEWPEYASYLKIELLETTSTDSRKPEYVVRFSLNGKLLRSNWHGKLRDVIPLNVLAHYVKTEGAVKVT